MAELPTCERHEWYFLDDVHARCRRCGLVAPTVTYEPIPELEAGRHRLEPELASPPMHPERRARITQLVLEAVERGLASSKEHGWLRMRSAPEEIGAAAQVVTEVMAALEPYLDEEDL